MLEQIAEAETRLKEVAAAQTELEARGIGHNNPPEPIEDAPASQKELEDLRKELEALKAQPVVLDEAGQQAAERSRGRLTEFAAKIGTWVVHLGNTYITKAVEEAGKETGKWAIRGTLAYVALKDQLLQIALTVGQWLSSVSLPF